MTSPTRQQLTRARKKAGLSTPEAAALVGVTVWAWASWSCGRRTMPGNLWELFLLKTKLDPEGLT